MINTELITFKNKTIVFYYPTILVGGIETAILSLVKAICENNKIIIVHAADYENSSVMLEQYEPFVDEIIDLYELKEKIECDILIHCSVYYSKIDTGMDKEGNGKLIINPRNYIDSKVKSKKTFLWVHCLVPPFNTKLQNLSFIRSIDKIIVVGEGVKATIPEAARMVIGEKNIEIINNLFDLEIIKEKSLERVRNINYQNDKLYFLTAARITSEKGWHRIKIICEILIKNNIDFEWHVVGKGPKGDYDKYVVPSILGHYKQIKWLGEKANPFRYMSKVDFVVQPSDYESWCNAITEARILGVPVITTDFPAAFEQIKDMINGIILPMKLYRYYEEKILWAINNKEKLKTNSISYSNLTDINNKNLEKWNSLMKGE